MQESLVHLIREISDFGRSGAQVDDILHHTIQRLVKVSEAYQGWVGFPKGNVIDYRYGINMERHQVAITRGLTSKAIQQRDIIYAPDINAIEDYITYDDGAKSELVLPIFYDDELLVVLNLMSNELHGFDPRFIPHDLYRTVIGTLALALYNCMEKERHQTLHDEGAYLNSILPLTELYRAISTSTERFIDYDRLVIVSFKDHSADIRIMDDDGADVHSGIIPLTNPMMAYLYQLKDVEEIEDLSSLPEHPLTPMLGYVEQVKSVMCAPMYCRGDKRVGAKPTGAIALLRKNIRDFTNRDHDTLTIIAQQAATSRYTSQKYADQAQNMRTSSLEMVAIQEDYAMHANIWQALVDNIGEVLHPTEHQTKNVVFYRYSPNTLGAQRLTQLVSYGHADEDQLEEALLILDRMNVHDAQGGKQITMLPAISDLEVEKSGRHSLIIPVWEWADKINDVTDQLVGVVSIRSDELFTRGETELAQNLCRQAVNNFYYMEQGKRFKRLVSINHQLSRVPSREMLNRIVEDSQKLLDADCAALFEYNEKLNSLIYSHMIPTDHQFVNPSSEAAMSRLDIVLIEAFENYDEFDPYLIYETFTLPFDAPPKWRDIGNHFRSLLAVPVWEEVKQQMRLHAVIVVVCERPHAFNQDEQLALQALATQASIVIQNERRDKQAIQNRFDLDNAVLLINRLHDFNGQLKNLKGLVNEYRQGIEKPSLGELEKAFDGVMQFVEIYDNTKTRMEAAKVLAPEIFSAAYLGERIYNILRRHQRRLEQKSRNLEFAVTPMHYEMDNDWDVHVSENIFEAFEIMLDNAVDALESSGKESIIVAFDLYHDNARRFLKISVTDTGSGMTEYTVDNLFNFGFSRKKSVNQSSMGLGMWIAKRIIENNDGMIEVDRDYTKPHHGSRLLITLPLV